MKKSTLRGSQLPHEHQKQIAKLENEVRLPHIRQIDIAELENKVQLPHFRQKLIAELENEVQKTQKPITNDEHNEYVTLHPHTRCKKLCGRT